MTAEKIRLRHAEHCGWMVFTERTVNCFGREADARIPGLQALGFGVKKLYCKPGLIPDDGYVALFGETLRRLLEVAPGDAFAMSMLSRLGTSGKNGDLFIDFTEIDALSSGSVGGEHHE
ncbi:hypothetical protein BBB56_22490 [Candidatus Pantoea deserta]|uniref:Uncharacterized protein n=1 Tax=Candidatus Pantoea deserta TaxID=1869313 RepID=A0A3N4NA25_9GAMM|nr:hypothetical protein [Pantoea deserta]RPD93204.1 hypothetical protein BBB56_22490 [Pantoea deserta]